jgi:hypothetical protein
MSIRNSPNSPDLVPELGDLVTFVSRVFKSTTGKIIYRDDALIRIQDYKGRTKPVDFDLVDGGYFADRLGVTEIILHKKRTDPHFSKQLGVVVGELLEFYGLDGRPLASEETFVVEEVIATDDSDALRVSTKGLGAEFVLDFGFLGVPDGIGLIMSRQPHEEDAEFEMGVDAAEVAEEVEVFPGFDMNTLPAGLVEEIPTEERMYSDTLQRADMFSSLFIDVPAERQKDPRVMARLYRVSDVLLAMKNSVVVRDAGGGVVTGEKRSYTAETFGELLEKQPTGAPLATLMPVAAVRKVVYTDDAAAGGDRTDVTVRSDAQSLIGAIRSSEPYAAAAAVGGGANPFVMAMNAYLESQTAYTAAVAGTKRITVDQDVLRSQIPPTPVEGFPRDTVMPYTTKKGERIPLEAANLGKIENRVVRLLAANKITVQKTGATFVVAPADTAETVAHVVLPADIARRRTPIRSSVLLWDIQASAVQSRLTTTFYTALRNAMSDVRVLDGPGLQTKVAEIAAERLAPALAFISRENTTTLDNMGFRNLEFTEPVFEALKGAVAAGQETWLEAYKTLKASAVAATRGGSALPVAGVVAAGGGLLAAAVLGDASIRDIVTRIKERETLLETHDLVYAQEFLTTANGTLRPLWYALTSSGGDAESELVVATRDTYVRESTRIERNTHVRRAASAAFGAEPVLNNCKHVFELEKIRSIRDDAKRMMLLDAFIKWYHGGQKDNYLLCGLCNDTLVCKHEVIMLQEYLNPGRSEALHKALLLEYGNGVFEGAYICKNCGQKMREIEYDTHLEYDDEGRPLVGRTVVAAGDDEEVDELGLGAALPGEMEEEVPFKDPFEIELYKNARVLFERLGLVVSVDVYARVVNAAKKYLEERVKAKRVYNRARDAELAKGGKGGGTVPIIYEAYYANHYIGCLGALALLEFQTAESDVPVPMSGIAYSRSGFPLDGYDPASAGLGAFNYVKEGLSSLFLNAPTWRDTSWSALGEGAARKKEAGNALLAPIFSILAIKPANKPAPPPLEDVTAIYETRIAEARAFKAAVAEGTGFALASRADRVPPVFRPLPFADAAIGELGADAIGNLAQFERQVTDGDVSRVGPKVAARSRVLAQQVVGELNAAAKAGAIVAKGSPYSFSSCCHKRLGAAALTGLGISALGLDAARVRELDIVGAASRTVRLNDPASSAAGTHLYMPWNAPKVTAVLPTPQPEDYYKLFVKNCFKGRAYGMPHEYAPNNRCRNCEFECPASLLFPIAASIPIEASAKTRTAQMAAGAVAAAEEANAALAAAGVVVDEESFKELEAQIRRKHKVPTIVPRADVPILERLQALGATLLPSVVADAEDQFATLLTGLQQIQAEGLTDRIARITAIQGFAEEESATLDTVREFMSDLSTATTPAKKAAEIKDVLNMLNTLVERMDGNAGARNLMEAFVSSGEQVANNAPNVMKKVTFQWIPGIAKSHAELLKTIWGNLATATTETLRTVADLEEDVRAALCDILHKFTSWLSAWLRVWIDEFRPSPVMQAEEMALLLKWLLLTGLHALLNAEESPFYATIENPGHKGLIAKALYAWVVRTTRAHADMVAKYQLSKEEIEAELNDRSAKENAMFIKKFDMLDIDARRTELIKKKLKIGDWAVGNLTNMAKYNADFFEFERDQRAQMGVPEFEAAVGMEGGAARDQERGAARFGLGGIGGPEVVDVERDNLHYAEGGEEY